MTQDLQVTRWPSTDPPDEAALRAELRNEGLSAYMWDNAPGDTYSAHHHDYHKVIYVVRGAITFGLPDLNRSVDLAPGDRLDLPAGITHDARVGPEGVSCLEAHRDE